MDNLEMLRLAGDMARRGESFALATVVWREGPSSSQQGSRAVITADGTVHGWIGGACAEPVVVREAREVIATDSPRLLLLGRPDQFGGAVPDGMRVVPIACQSEGAIEVYVEPVVPAPHLVVVGGSPMVDALAGMARALDWQVETVTGLDFRADQATPRSWVVVATQGHGDEEAMEQAVAANPAYLGMVASHRRGEAVLGYLADRGHPAEVLERVQVPAGLDLGHTSHREVAVAILAELVRRRAAGETTVQVTDAAATADAVDPVCGMTVTAGPGSHPLVHEGVTYYFCRPGCRQAFEQNPAAYLTEDSRC